MRAPCFLFVLLAGIFQLVSAQGSNSITVPPHGFQVTAGQPVTVEWTNPSKDTVTIQLVPASGTGTGDIVTLGSVLPNTGRATLNVPSDIPTTQQYQFKITDDSNSSNTFLSSAFKVYPPIPDASPTSTSIGPGGATSSPRRPTTSSTTSSDSSLSTGAIVGVSIGGILGVVVLVVIAVFFIRRRRKHKTWIQQQQHQQQQQQQQQQQYPQRVSELPPGDRAPAYDLNHPYGGIPSDVGTQMVGPPPETKKWAPGGDDGARVVREPSEVSGSRNWPRELEGTLGYQRRPTAELPADPIQRDVGRQE